MKKKVLSILLVLTMVLGLFAGCGKKDDDKDASSGQQKDVVEDSKKDEGKEGKKEDKKEPVTLKMWCNWPESNDEDSQFQYVKKAAQKYMDLNPHVTIEVTGNSTMDKVLAALTGGQGPDVFDNLWPNIATWGEKGALLDLTDYVNNDAEFKKDDVLPAAWNLSTYKDTIYGIPYTLASSELYYNKKLLKEAGYDNPPETMEELVEMADKLTKVNDKGEIEQLGFLPDYPWLDNVLWPVTFGAEWIDKDANKITFDSPDMAAAYQWQVDIYKKYGVEELSKFKSGFGKDAQSPFLTGDLAMCFFPEGMIGMVAKYAPDLDYGIANIPYPADKPDLKGSMFVTSRVYCINSKSKNPDAAWDFLAFWANEDNMKEWSNGQQKKGALVSRASVLNNMGSEVPQELKDVAKMLQSPNVRSFPMLPYINEYLSIINDEMTLALHQKQSVEEAQKKVVEQVQKLADENPVK
ncbi:ABC transporter substrate-binding protein [Xylanivirga thermophila]|uniref:ABC transporter substrate-binding protein n=1 Tax=Xylanivirga thermophila TaxID=2496273 RepID=UPI0013ED0206|nr:ABC transporter substrate-binding protein [Xylanivirga thermophila]